MLPHQYSAGVVCRSAAGVEVSGELVNVRSRTLVTRLEARPTFTQTSALPRGYFDTDRQRVHQGAGFGRYALACLTFTDE